MLRTGAVVAKRIPVRLSAVSFVSPEAVVRIDRIQRTHHVVAVHFGNDRCGADRRNQAIATDDGGTIDLTTTEPQVR